MSLNLEQLGYQHVENPGYFRIPGDAPPFWYNESDEQEEWVASVVERAADKGVFSRELRRGIRDWQSLYQLSQLRANLLRPVAPYISGEVLEVGAGMGAVTRALGEAGVRVIALEASERRARTCATRTEDLPNVQVVCDTIQNFRPGVAFDTVIVIGVLEYARVFGFPGGGQDPVDQMLEMFVGLLRPDGKLILAIENQLGLKYFAGFPEDHLGEPMWGIEDRYLNVPEGRLKAVTFGRRELYQKIERSGLGHQAWFYPFPDYKLPTVVASTEALAPDSPVDVLPLLQIAAEQDPQEPESLSFEMARAWAPILRNGLAADLSNSFLVVASKQPLKKLDEMAWVYGSVPQSREFAKVAAFVVEDGIASVRRRPLVPSQDRTRGLWRRTFPDEPYHRTPNWSSRLKNIVHREGWTLGELADWFTAWHDAVLEVCGLPAGTPPDHVLPPQMFDALPRNLIFSCGGPVFVDLEVEYLEELTLGELAYRAVAEDVLSLRWVAPPAPETSLARATIARELFDRVGVEVDRETLTSRGQNVCAFASAVVGDEVKREDPLSGRFDVRPSLGAPGSVASAAFRTSLQVARKRAAVLEGQRDVLLAELEATRQALGDVGRENVRLGARLGAAEMQLAQVHDSVSWKVTRPLRAIRSLGPTPS